MQRAVRIHQNVHKKCAHGRVKKRGAGSSFGILHSGGKPVFWCEPGFLDGFWAFGATQKHGVWWLRRPTRPAAGGAAGGASRATEGHGTSRTSATAWGLYKSIGRASPQWSPLTSGSTFGVPLGRPWGSRRFPSKRSISLGFSPLSLQGPKSCSPREDLAVTRGPTSRGLGLV